MQNLHKRETAFEYNLCVWVKNQSLKKFKITDKPYLCLSTF